jgi:hypothetical protein
MVASAARAKREYFFVVFFISYSPLVAEYIVRCQVVAALLIVGRKRNDVAPQQKRQSDFQIYVLFLHFFNPF